MGPSNCLPLQQICRHSGWALRLILTTGPAGESNTIRIGNSRIAATFIRGISGATAVDGAAVFVNSAGHLGTLTSSARFKDGIKPMGNAGEAILALRPVSFRYKKEIDPQGIRSLAWSLKKWKK